MTILALMIMSGIFTAVADADSDTNEIPPFMLVDKPRSIEPTLDGYRTVGRDGRTEYWRRTLDGYSTGSRVITKSLDGYRSSDGAFARRQLDGWVISKDGTNTTIRESLSGYVVDDTYIYRGVSGYRSRVVPPDGLELGAKQTPVKRMKNAKPSAFRRWDENGRPVE